MRSKNAVPEKMEGIIFIAGKKYKVGSIESAVKSSPKELKRAVRKLSNKKVFSLPSYSFNE